MNTDWDIEKLLRRSRAKQAIEVIVMVLNLPDISM